MGKKSTPDQELASLTTELRKSFDRWADINEHGCSDPHWPDGLNMNLVHNHICYHKGKIKALCETLDRSLPDDYHRETPPLVSDDFMARAREIRDNAQACLTALLSEPALAVLRAHAYDLIGPKALAVSVVFRGLHDLQSAIETDNLVTMRRYGDGSGTLARVRELAGSISANDMNPQLSLLSFLDDNTLRMNTPPPPRKTSKHKGGQAR